MSNLQSSTPSLAAFAAWSADAVNLAILCESIAEASDYGFAVTDCIGLPAFHGLAMVEGEGPTGMLADAVVRLELAHMLDMRTDTLIARLWAGLSGLSDWHNSRYIATGGAA